MTTQSQPIDDMAIFDFRHHSQDMSEEALAAIQAEHGAHINRFSACRYLAYQRAVAEAAHLGLTPHPEEGFIHDPLVLVASATGINEGRAIAQQYGFYPEGLQPQPHMPSAREEALWQRFLTPNSMWHVLAYRRSGDAIIALIGDDRGYASDWQYWVAVAWCPRDLLAAAGYNPMLPITEEE